jgi:transposase
MTDRFIGLDVHKATIAVAIAEDGRRGEIRHYGTIRHRPEAIAKLIKRLAVKGTALHFCCEAGPCGYGLHRQIIEAGHTCIVVAPSVVPVKQARRNSRRCQRRDG